MPGPFYFAWTGPDEAFGPQHIREDEEIFSIDMSHTEGNFADLQIELINPRVGLLSPLRNQWCWLSYDRSPAKNGSDIRPFFRGRLVGVPADLQNEVLKLEFLARPVDYVAQQMVLAQSLQVLPFYDPLFIDPTAQLLPGTTLEGYSALWHIDRITLHVTVSDIIQGEDGTFVVEEEDHFYDGVSMSYTGAPLTSVNVQANVVWKQTGGGDVDITDQLIAAYFAEDRPFTPNGLGKNTIASLTAAGLIASWPVPGTSMGGGWSVGAQTSCEAADQINAPTYDQIAQFNNAIHPSYSGSGDFLPLLSRYGVAIKFVDQNPNPTNPFTGLPEAPDLIPNSLAIQMVEMLWPSFIAFYPLGSVTIKFQAHYEINRDRSEVVLFTLPADVQSILTDPEDAATETITVNSASVSDPVDTADSGDSSIPIGDVLRRSYFQTDRGILSFQYLINLARVRILSKARAVNLTFEVDFDFALDITLRMNVELHDRRLPGAVAIGKIIGVEFLLSDAGAQTCKITIGCTVGHGGTLTVVNGVNDYATDGYMDAGYQVVRGALYPIFNASIQYEDLSDFEVQGDGVDLLHMDSSLASVVCLNGPDQQKQAIEDSLNTFIPDPSGALTAAPTKFTVMMKSVDGQSYQTTFQPIIAPMIVPKTIDLEAEIPG